MWSYMFSPLSFPIADPSWGFHASKRQPRNVFVVTKYVWGKEGTHAFLKLTQQVDTKFVISGVEGGLVPYRVSLWTYDDCNANCTM